MQQVAELIYDNMIHFLEVQHPVGKIYAQVMTQQQEKSNEGKHLPRCFTNELQTMMHGFGDSINPRSDSVELMQELVLIYLHAFVTETFRVAHLRRRERPDVSDIRVVIRKDKRKLQRVRYLLNMKEEINKACKVDHEAMVEE